MTGAGTADLAFAKESTFLGSLSGAPDYYKFGRDPTLDEASLDNVLQRMREPDAVWDVESVKDNFEGAVTVSAVINAAVLPDVEDLVFNDTDGSGNKIISAGRPQTGRIFAGVNYLDGTAERVLRGTIPESFSIQYQQDGKGRFSLSMLYADEEKNTSITPSSPTGPADGGHVAATDMDFLIGGTSISKLQSATLSIASIARFQRDGDPTPADVVVASPTATLETTGIYSGDSRLERALGSSGATDAEDYSFSRAKPATYDWQDLVAGDADLTEVVTWNVSGTDAVSVS